jgi:hypothetical protein
MTQPVSYEPKPPAEIQAMFNNGDASVVEDIVDWINASLAWSDSVTVTWGNRINFSAGDSLFVCGPNQYVCLNEDGFHVVDKGPFELLFKVSDGI